MNTHREAINEFQKQANALEKEIRLLQEMVTKWDESEIREFISLIKDIRTALAQHQRSVFVADGVSDEPLR